ncbi:NAD(P)H-dependent oxidoreductase [Halobacteriovorax marinus]|nr:NAD(P)H-dependent oxidoreductase [Halobacteriovorax marinus]
MRNILVIQGHTDSSSLTHSLSLSYIEARKKSGDKVNVVDLSVLDFNPILEMGYKEIMPLEDSLLECQSLIKEADHITIFYPTWWGTLPAKLKGFFDRVLLPGFAFKFEEGKTLPTKLLKGKTASIITTLDTPPWYYRYFQGNLGVRTLKNLILSFCGIKTKKIIYIGPVIKSSEEKRSAWIEKMKKLDS